MASPAEEWLGDAEVAKAVSSSVSSLDTLVFSMSVSQLAVGLEAAVAFSFESLTSDSMTILEGDGESSSINSRLGMSSSSIAFHSNVCIGPSTKPSVLDECSGSPSARLGQ